MSANLIIIIHAIFGFISIATGMMIIAMNKECNTHKIFGYVFIVSTIISAICGSLIALNNGKYFFISIGIATILQIIMGIRILSNKKFIMSNIDKIVLFLFTLNSVVFFIYNTSITISLGILYLFIAIYQMYLFSSKKEITKMMWLSQHISHMLGAVLSVLTAFIVGNIGNYSLFGFMWIVPAIVAIPLVRYFKLKYAPGRATKGIIKW